MKRTDFFVYLVGLFAAVLLATTSAYGAPPNDYYAAAAELDGQALRQALHDTIVNHQVLPYSSTRFDVHDGIDVLDELTEQPDAVRLLYSNSIAKKTSWPGYNREHVWPVSLGAADGTPAHTDLHHIFACDANVNSARGNRPYDECEGDCNTHIEAPDAPFSARAWEPPDHQKGDVARALFYMDVRYEGDFQNEPDLRLVEWGVESGCNCMGRLSRLRAWHELDPVDDAERQRNDSVYAIQGNRNPFVDHPEWVDSVYDVVAIEEEDFDIYDPTEIAPWVNEFHYDNEGVDINEGIEIAGEAGMRLWGWTILLYNGRDGRAYAEIALDGTIDDEGLGFGAVWFEVPRMQNGGADAIALVDPTGHVVEFISYEGALVALDGPANGMMSTDIGLVENEQTQPLSSLQRIGIGFDGLGFAWGGALRSPGVLNYGQTLLRSVRFPVIGFELPFLFPMF